MSMHPITISFKNDYSIEKITEDLYETIAKLKGLMVETNDLEKIQQKLYVLNLFANRQIVSIAGLQSVGKTSLIKRYLDFPEDLLEAEVGVGEKRPVLISADETLKSPAYYSVSTKTSESGYPQMFQESISKEDLNKGVQNPPINTLWYEIKIPKNDKIGHLTLALLPGFERNKQSDSQLFLDLFLNCSTGMILVLNHLRLAQQSQHELLDKVANTYKEKEPGFVLTFADDLKDEEKRKTIKDNLIKKFQLDSDEQILLSDINDSSVTVKLEKLIKQNSLYGLNAAGMHIKQQLLISEQLSMYLMKAEESVKSKFLSEQNLQSFDYDQSELYRSKEAYLEEVRETLTLRMNDHIALCEKRIEKILSEEKSSHTKKIKAFFKNDLTYKEVQDLKEEIKRIYMSEDPYKTNKIIVNAIGEASDKYLNKRLPVIVKYIKGSSEKTLFTSTNNTNIGFGDFEVVEGSSIFSNEFGSAGDFKISTKDKNGEITKGSDIDIKEYSIDNQRNFVVDHTLAVVEEFVKVEDNEFKGLTIAELEVIPVLAGGIAQHALATTTLMDRKNINSLSGLKVFNKNQEGIELVKKEIDHLALDTNHLIKGSVLFFGVDSLDGTMNSFGALTGVLKMFGVTTLAPAVAAGGIGLLGAAIAFKKGGDKLEKYKFERDEMAKNLIRFTAENQIEVTMRSLEKVLEDIEFQLKMAKSSRKNEHNNLPAYSEVQIRIAHMQKECGNLREMAYRNESFINKLSPKTI